MDRSALLSPKVIDSTCNLVRQNQLVSDLYSMPNVRGALAAALSDVIGSDKSPVDILAAVAAANGEPRDGAGISKMATTTP